MKIISKGDKISWKEKHVERYRFTDNYAAGD